MNTFFIVCMYVLIKFNVTHLFDFNAKDSDITFQLIDFCGGQCLS